MPLTSTRLAASAFSCALLLTGCKPTLLPSPTVAHKLAEPAEVRALVRRPDGTLEVQRLRFEAGDYCATARALDRL
jgi:hypothetical protein